MKTTTIGRDTPILTYQIFRSLAEKNEREAQRKQRIERMKATVLFWKRDRDQQRKNHMEQMKATLRFWRKEDA